MNGIKTIPISKKLPKYGYPINRTMIQLDDSRIMAAIRVEGMPFEAESVNSLTQAFQSVKFLFNQLAKKYGGSLAIWTHVVKQKDHIDTEYQFDNRFVQSFNDKYINSFSGQRFFSTFYCVTYVLKYKGTLAHAEKEMDEILKLSAQVFKPFQCSTLSISDDGKRCGNIEFLSSLLNHDDRKIPLTSNKVIDVIGSSDWHFGYDLLEIRNTDSHTSRYATFFELDAFPPTTKMGMWDFILSQQCEFVLTQSILLMRSADALKVLDTQKNLVESGDNAAQEIEMIEGARDYVATGDIQFGDYHFSLAIFGDTEQQVLKDGKELSGEFLSRGTMLKRSNLKSQFSFLSTLPGSNQRAMSSPRTVTNLCCTWSLHNYSKGKKSGNPIGDGSAIIPLKTLSDSIFHFNCHASEIGKNVTGQKYAGHAMLLGASGAGKTTLEATIAAYMQRFNPQMFAIDYNRSTELFMRAFGAQYFTIRDGVDTGLNPFQLKDTPTLRSFLNNLVSRLCSNHQGVITEVEQEELKNGIDTIMRMDTNKRCLSLLLQTIQTPDLRTRLGRWCRSTNGQYAWCLDSPQNKFDPDMMDKIGFDTTSLLKKGSDGKPNLTSEPILAVLFFIKDLMQKEGRLMMSIVEEFWMPANEVMTSSLMMTILKAGRLKNEFMILSSQSPEDAINCNIFPAIVQQTATKIFLPNPDAEFESYKRCNLNKGEFDKLKTFGKLSRTFLIKQSNTSCFAKLDLYGFDEHLPVLSGTDDVINECEKIRAEFGDDPEIWIPKLQEFFRKKKDALA
ncbi:conjugal transfer protein TraE [Vibrio fluvialis]|uniref:VirB4 family type IV secretion/conjugal transfer ATPase n=1 Tax=Vibrio fluvialis TaxID=676 RepID=UPI00399BB0CD